MPADDVAVGLRSVSVEFGMAGGGVRRVLSDLSLDVPRGQFLAVIGANGCGKTTILNVVAGLVVPTRGDVAVLGAPPSVGRKDVGYMFARDALLDWRTARQNVELGLELRRLGRAARRQRAAELLERMDMRAAHDRYPVELSQGTRQRVALARTWAADPQLLLMDEPFAALDAQTRSSVRDTFLDIWNEDEPKTVLFVTHDLAEALLLADRVVLVADGAIRTDLDVTFDRPRRQRELMIRDDYHALYAALEQGLSPS